MQTVGVKEELANQLLAACDSIFSPGLEAIIAAHLPHPSGKPLLADLRADLHERLASAFEKMPDEQCEPLKQGIQRLRTIVSDLVELATRKMFPRPGGRPSTIDKTMQRQAVNAVLTAIGGGLTLAQAVNTVAPQCGLAPDQLRRYWKKRKHIPQLPAQQENKPAQPPTSMQAAEATPKLSQEKGSRRRTVKRESPSKR